MTTSDCAIYRSKYGVRMEDDIEGLKIFRLGFGSGVDRKYRIVGKDVLRGYVNEGEFKAPPYEKVLEQGVHPISK